MVIEKIMFLKAIHNLRINQVIDKYKDKDNELVAYIKSKRYTLNELIELNAIEKISTKWETLKNSLPLEDIGL